MSVSVEVEAILTALAEQGVGVAWRGEGPSGSGDVTQEFVEAHVAHAGEVQGIDWPTAQLRFTELLLEKGKQKRVEELKEEARQRITSGFQSAVLGATHTYPSSPTDQQNLSGLAQLASVDGLGGAFWCADASGAWARRAHTAEQILQLGRDFISHVQEVQAAYEVALGEVAAAGDIAQVRGVVL